MTQEEEEDPERPGATRARGNQASEEFFFEPRPEAEEESGEAAHGEAEDASDGEAPVAVRWEPKLPREPKNRELAQFLQRCDPKRRVGVDAF